MDRKLLLGLIFLFGGFLFVSLASRRITAACSQERTQAKKVRIASCVVRNQRLDLFVASIGLIPSQADLLCFPAKLN